MIRKFFHRLMVVAKLIATTLASLGFSKWYGFWFTKKNDEVSVKSFRFKLRNANIFSKISDLAMVYDSFSQYKNCKINESDIVIDVGAHIGGFSLLAASLAKKGKVFSYEPYGPSFALLTKNILINKAKNIHAFNLAVSKKSGETDFYVNDMNLAENSLSKKTSKVLKVKTITLKKLMDSNKIARCNVLKMDCEGAEYDILFSSKDVLPRINKIIFEYHEPKYFGIANMSVEKLINFLKENGFNVKVKKANYYQGIMCVEK